MSDLIPAPTHVNGAVVEALCRRRPGGEPITSWYVVVPDGPEFRLLIVTFDMGYVVDQRSELLDFDSALAVLVDRVDLEAERPGVV